MNERLASHSLTAFSANVSKTGWRSNVERPITLSSSLVVLDTHTRRQIKW
jgi:hypothetical protein